VAAVPLQHLDDDRWVSQKNPVRLTGVIGERLGDVDAGVVDEGVDAAEASECPLTIRSAVAGSARSPSTVSTSASSIGFMVRAVATTLPAFPVAGRDQAGADAREPPVMKATFWS
jgi:hypothetical protein